MTGAELKKIKFPKNHRHIVISLNISNKFMLLFDDGPHDDLYDDSDPWRQGHFMQIIYHTVSGDYRLPV